MSRDINEYFHEHCDKMFCEECEMENDQKEEYVCYHQGFYVKGYEQGRADRDREIAESNVFFSNRPIEDIVLEARADERERIVRELEELSDSYFQKVALDIIDIAIKIVRDGEVKL